MEMLMYWAPIALCVSAALLGFMTLYLITMARELDPPAISRSWIALYIVLFLFSVGNFVLRYESEIIALKQEPDMMYFDPNSPLPKILTVSWRVKPNCHALSARSGEFQAVWDEHLPPSEDGNYHISLEGKWTAGEAPKDLNILERMPVHFVSTWRKDPDALVLWADGDYVIVQKWVLPLQEGDALYHMRPDGQWVHGPAPMSGE